MTLGRGRVIKAAFPEEGAAPVLSPGPSAAQRRRMARETLEAHLEAERVVAVAQERADAVLSHARSTASASAAEAAQAAQAAEQAKLAAAYLAMQRSEDARAEKDLDRTIALAVALAERLLGATLELDPSRVALLARQTLAEARGARRATFDAHPLDAEALASELSTFGLPAGAIDVRADSTLTRGHLRLHTDLGTLDAKLTPQLERLAAVLRDALR